MVKRAKRPDRKDPNHDQDEFFVFVLRCRPHQRSGAAASNGVRGAGLLLRRRLSL